MAYTNKGTMKKENKYKETSSYTPKPKDPAKNTLYTWVNQFQNQKKDIENEDETFEEWSNRKRAEESMDSWLHSNSPIGDELVREIDNHYSSYQDKNDSWYDDFQSRTLNLQRIANSYRSKYKNDGNAIVRLESLNDTLDNLRNYATQRKDYYSQWNSKDEYDKYVKEKEELTGGYDPVRHKAEGTKGWEDYTNYLKDLEDGEEDKKWYDKVFEYLGSANVGQPTSAKPIATQSIESNEELDKALRTPDDRWSEDDRMIFGYLWNQDQEKAEKYAIEVNSQLNLQQKSEKIQAIQESATDGLWKGVGHTAMTLPATSFGIKDTIDDVLAYRHLGYIPESSDVSPSDYARAVESGISAHLNESFGTINDDVPIIGGAGLGDVYSLARSEAQSLFDAYTLKFLGPLAKTASKFLLYGRGAASAFEEAKNRGLQDDKALILGAVGGLAEVIGESSQLEHLMSIGPSVNWNGFIGTVLKQGGLEAGGEATTSVINNLADYMISGDKSNYELLRKQYLDQGIDPVSANKKALQDIFEDITYDALSGFAMGAGGASAFGGVATVADNRNAKKNYGPVQQDLVGEALQIDPDNKLANKMQERLDNKKKLSGSQLRRLVDQTSGTVLQRQVDAAYDKAVRELTQLGETGDVEAIADAIAVKQTGQKLTKSEERLINNSDYGQRVMYEMQDAEEQKRKDYTAWYQKIVADAQIAREKEIVSELNKSSTVVPEASEKAVDDPNGVVSEVEVDTDDQTAEINENVAEGKTILSDTHEVVDIESISAVSDGKMTVRLTDGREVSSDSISYGSQPVHAVYTSVQAMATSPEKANTMVNGFEDGMKADDYIRGMQLAYTYGKNGIVLESLERSSGTVRNLPEAVKKAAYESGQVAGGLKFEDEQAAIDARKKTGGKKVNNQGKVHFEGDRSTLNERQRVSLDALDRIASTLGVQIHMFDSKVDKQYKNTNGWYDPKDHSIHLDLHAGNHGESVILFTAAHELTHFVREWSPKKFKILSDFLMSEYGEAGVNVDALIDAQMKKDKSLSRDAALEEVVADSMEKMLVDGNALEKLEKLKAQDRTLWEKIRDFISDLVTKIRKVYKDMDAETLEGQYVSSMLEQVEKLQDLFVEAVADASESYQESLIPGEEGVIENKNGEPVAYSTEDGSVLFSLRTYEEDGRKALHDYLRKCVSSKRLTKSEMDDMIEGIEDIYQTCKEFKDKYAPFSAWSEAEVVRDTHGKPVFSVVTPNGEYKMNLDFSLVCRKRRTLDAVFNEMSKRGIIDDFELGQKSVVKINEIIRKYGLETACALCFVDAKRFRQASTADSFVNLYNELVESLVPTDRKEEIDHFNFAGYDTVTKVDTGIHTWKSSELDFSHIDHVLKNYESGTVEYKAAKYIKANANGRKLLLRGDFMSSGGFDAVKTQNADILKLYNSKKGTGGPKAAFGDVQYMNEIIQKARYWTPAKAYAVGGVRIQSFSDYVPRMVFDYVQMIYDLAATKLPAHAYTKEELFAKQFGLTGVKINMSLIPAIAKNGVAPGLDANGDYAWAGESFNYETAKEIQNAEGYTENCGTICVGVSREHILKLLSDPDIRMVIPYHKSGLNPIVAHMNKIAEFTDYTSLKTNPGGCQNTIDKSGSKVSNDFNFNQVLSKTGDPKETVRQYLEWCAKKEYTPRFAEFAWHENYYKLIEDFTLYDKDGNYVPQREVKAVFPKEGSAFGSMKELIQTALEEDAIIEGKRNSSLSDMVDEIERTIPRTEAEISEEQVDQAERDLESAIMRDDFADNYVKYSKRVTDKETLDFLDSQATITTYKTMQLVDGHLYPPMAARIEGKHEDYSVLGEWEQATEHPELIKNGNKFKLDKGKGQGSIEAAYNPYMHSSNLVLNDQFSAAYTRDNLVTIECAVPASEMTSGYHAEFAKDSVGWHAWHTGTVAGQIRKQKGVERQVFLSRWIKPVRIVPDSEVAAMYKELLDGTDVAVPDNVVTPMLREELEKAGVAIKKSEKVKYSQKDTVEFSSRGVLESYSIKSINDYVGVQKAVIRTLNAENFFDGEKNIVTNRKSGMIIEINKRGIRETLGSDDRFHKLPRNLKLQKLATIRLLPSIIEGAYVDRDNAPNVHSERSGVKYAYLRSSVNIDGEDLYVTVSIRKSPQKNLFWIHEIRTVKKEQGLSSSEDNSRQREYNKALVLDERISQEAPEVKYSLRDSEGSELTTDQQEYFKNSVVRDENGNLKRMYHGTANFGHMVFDPWSKSRYGLFGMGAYFTDDPEVAISYSNKGKTQPGKQPGVYEVYLNITNPIDMDAQANRSEWVAQMPDAEGYFPKAGTNEQFYRAMEEYMRDEMFTSLEAYETALDTLIGMGYDGVTHIGGGRFRKSDTNRHQVYIAFEAEQVKFFDNEHPTADPDIRYSKRGPSLSNRSLLANALEGVTQNSVERKRLQEYKKTISQIEAEEQRLVEIRSQIKALSKNQDTQQIEDLKIEGKRTANRINTYDSRLLRFEAMQPIQNVLEREKAKAFSLAEKAGENAIKAFKREQKKLADQRYKQMAQDYTQKRKEAVSKSRESIYKRDAREKLQKTVLDTINWLTSPKKSDIRCPDILKGPYAEFLKGIDLSSRQLASGGDMTVSDEKIALAMRSLADAIENIVKSQRISSDEDNSNSSDVVDVGMEFDAGYLDLPVNFVDYIKKLSNDITKGMESGNRNVNDMSVDQIRSLRQMILTLNHSIREMNALYANMRYYNILDLGRESMSHMDSLGKIESENKLKNFTDWENALPYYAFKRFGKGGESIFEGLMNSQDKLAGHADTIFKFKEGTWKDTEVKAWSEDPHEINLPSGGQLMLTSADAMSIYCLSKRNQGLKHLLGGGVRVIGYTKGSKKFADTYSLLTEADLKAIKESLSERQIKVADAIQKFMSEVCAEWGNEISMKRFLTRDFGDEYYFPIESNEQDRKKQDPTAKQSDLYRLLNISATKELNPDANNQINIRNIFEVFANHSTDMAKLNAFGMSLLDYMKWLNYRERIVNDEGKVESVGVDKSMDNTYGSAAGRYVLNLIKDVNGRPSDNNPTLLMKWMKASKTASVGFSLKVATLQVTSYPRASLILSGKALAAGLTKKPNFEMAKKYCGIVQWKAFGFYDTNITKSVEEQIKGASNWRQKMIEFSLKGAEIGDALTIGALWNACEFEVSKTSKNARGSEEFYQEVAMKLREVIYSTQVVDSTLTRSEMMRSKNGLKQEASAFMSEPTVSWNILMDAAWDFQMEKRKIRDKVSNRQKAMMALKRTGKHLRRAVMTYTIGVITSALLESAWDRLRDDEDEETYLEALRNNLIEDLLPFGKIPIISDVWSAALSQLGVGYYSSNKMTNTWVTDTLAAIKAIEDAFKKDSNTTIYGALYKSVKAGSTMTGIGFSGALRDAVTLWNNTAGRADYTLKVRQRKATNADLGNELYKAIMEDDADQAESIYDELRDKYPDEVEYKNKVSTAIMSGLRKNDSRIWEAAVAWNDNDLDTYLPIAKEITADGFNQDDVVMAIRSEAASMEEDKPASERNAKGYFTAEKFAIAASQNNSKMAKMAKEDIIATNKLNGKSEKDAISSFKSSAKSELKELYLAGGITKERLKKALVTYCDMTAEEADLQVQAYDWKQDGYEVSAEAIDDYNKYCSSAGVSKEVFIDVRKFKGVEGTKKENVEDYIHKLNLTSKQKDALYFACGYAESTLKNTPWH